MGLLHLLTFSLLLFVSGAKFSGRPGVNYGQLGDSLPSPTESVKLIRSLNATRVKIYDADHSILEALNGTDIAVSVMVPNEMIVNISKSRTQSDNWVLTNVLPFYPTTKILYLLVGNEVLSNPHPELRSGLVPAMRKIKQSLKRLGVHKVKVGTTLAMDVLQTSYPPSSGEFRSDISGLVMKPMLQFLNKTKSFLFVDVYPYFAWSQDPRNIDLDYALFESKNITITDPATNLTYHNLFDQMVDAFVFAMERIGYPDIRIWVSETGWPNNGDYDQIGANIFNAATYNRNVVKKLTIDPPVGTPARPGRVLPAFIFSLYNENQKPGPGTERHFGLYNPNGNPVYDMDLSGKTTEYEDVLPEPGNNEPYKGKIWCVVAKGANWTELGEALSYACSQGNNTCDPIRPGGPCNKPEFILTHASFAFSSYWAEFRKSGATCHFNGLATQTVKDPSYGRCEFPSVTL
ncbi:PREDICTED: probable glucan endo-1,3-beta-glucosidase A6 [Tarenaya hassleriana]|uniref:probable glucan endo-1,3-beta-glucosidase A6 n=1 Tax=Tarenaya hassleriana TaxID=28532 RepID=UPI00053C7FFB|nr:PREDICTED: probable glucan endo-1,3-beta-glucosidase A6 [Tarenaya hassleriana]